MNTDAISTIEELIHHAGEDWILDWFSPRSDVGNRLRSMLSRINARAQELLPHAHLDFSQEKLIAQYKRSPHKVRAFIQAFAETDSPDMLIMVWRVLQGMEIAKVEIKYIISSQFGFTVALRSPYGDPDEVYKSNDIDDAALFRHFGILKMEGPVFDGFYPIERPS